MRWYHYKLSHSERFGNRCTEHFTGRWVDKNLGSSSASLESDGEDFDADLNLINSEAAYALEDWS